MKVSRSISMMGSGHNIDEGVAGLDVVGLDIVTETFGSHPTTPRELVGDRH
jgi:hypothetical protein